MDNPFIAPQEEGSEATVGPEVVEHGPVPGVEVDGDLLVVRDGAVLPARCIKTNRPVSGPLRRKSLYWAPAWIYLLVLVHVLILLLVYFIVRKRVALQFALSPEAARALLKRHLVNWGVFLGSVGCLVLAGVLQDGRMGPPVPGALAVAGLVGLLVSLVLLVVWGGALKVRRYRDGRFWIKGCSPAFLDSLR